MTPCFRSFKLLVQVGLDDVVDIIVGMNVTDTRVGIGLANRVADGLQQMGFAEIDSTINDSGLYATPGFSEICSAAARAS